MVYRFVLPTGPGEWTRAYRFRNPYRDEATPINPDNAVGENTQLPAQATKSVRVPIPADATGRGLLVAHEHYEDPAAMMAHLSGMDPADIAVLVGAVEITSMRLFGPATAELRATLASFGTAEYFDFVSGFTR